MLHFRPFSTSKDKLSACAFSPHHRIWLTLPSFSLSLFFWLSLSMLVLWVAKRSQSISNCVHLYEALPATKSVPMLLHTVSSFLPGISHNSHCSHRLSGNCTVFVCLSLQYFHFLSHHLSSVANKVWSPELTLSYTNKYSRLFEYNSRLRFYDFT